MCKATDTVQNSPFYAADKHSLMMAILIIAQRAAT